MQEYIKQDADIMPFLLNIEKGKYLQEPMLSGYIYQSDEDYFLILITELHIVCIDIKGRYVIWQMNTRELEQVIKSQYALTLRTSNNRQETLMIPDKTDIEAMYNILQNAREFISHLIYI